MKVDNPLTRGYLTAYPADAARVLEQLSEQHIVALLSELPVQTVTPVIGAMLPEKVAAVLVILGPSSAAKIVAELPISSAVRIYRLLAPEVQTAVADLLSDKNRRSLLRHLTYPSSTAGALLNPGVYLLAENITVSDAIRRIEHGEHVVNCDIYIINETHQLVGTIELGKLLISKHQLRLRDIMSRKTQAISAHANLSSLSNHPGWKTKRQLPVVERDKTVVGVLDYRRLQDTLGETVTGTPQDPLNNLLSLASLYWLSMAQLLDSLLSIRTDKGKKK